MGARSRLLIVLCSSFLIAVFLTLFLRTGALATPDYAQQTGQPCSTCHARPEGGGELTPVGVAFARDGYQWPVPEEPEAYTPSILARVLRLIAGSIHLVVTVIWFGTIFYVHIVLGPDQLMTGMPRTEGIIGRISMFVMALTGIALTIFRYLETGFVYTGFFGTVFIIKLILFAIMVILAFIALVPVERRLRHGKGLVAAPPASPEEITLETLAFYDGEEGTRAIVAVGSKLYDVTNSRLWRDGVHMKRHQAGHDLTEALKDAPHGEELLDRVPMVGELRTVPAKAGPRMSSAQRAVVAIGYVNLALMFGILLCVAWLKFGFS